MQLKFSFKKPCWVEAELAFLAFFKKTQLFLFEKVFFSWKIAFDPNKQTSCQPRVEEYNI